MKKIAVFTSGGDAPGMNACIHSVVRTAHHYNIEVEGVLEGYCGMINESSQLLLNTDVAGIIGRGGTILRSSRCPDFKKPEMRKKAANYLNKIGVEGIVAIGGNGTFAGALHFERECGIPTIGIPGTIDNDLFGTDYTIGFDTACNTTVKAIDALVDTATSHNRLFIVEVMGRDAGHIAVSACIAGGCEGALLPEKTDDLPMLMSFLNEKRKKKVKGSIIVVAEGDEVGGAFKLNNLIKEKYPQYDTRVTILGHIQRGGSPTVFDRILGSRLGMNAVEALRNNQRNEAVGIVNKEVVFTSFEKSITKSKSIHPDLLKMSNILVA